MEEEDHHTDSHDVAEQRSQNKYGRNEVVKQEFIEFPEAFPLDEDTFINREQVFSQLKGIIEFQLASRGSRRPIWVFSE